MADISALTQSIDRLFAANIENTKRDINKAGADAFKKSSENLARRGVYTGGQLEGQIGKDINENTTNALANYKGNIDANKANMLQNYLQFKEDQEFRDKMDQRAWEREKKERDDNFVRDTIGNVATTFLGGPLMGLAKGAGEQVYKTISPDGFQAYLNRYSPPPGDDMLTPDEDPSNPVWYGGK